MVKHSECGVVIVGVNRMADIKATRVADSVKSCMPDMHITFFTDQPIKANIPSINNIIRIPGTSDDPCLSQAEGNIDKGIVAKMTYINKCDYKYTLYLDYDIFVTDSIWEIFDTLEGGGFDLAVAPYQVQQRTHNRISDCFPFHNAGMIAWKKSDKTDAFFKLWWDKYIAISCGNNTTGDEIVFQECLYESKDLRYFPLTEEYNYRPFMPCVVGKKIKIIHGIPSKYRLKSLLQLADNINGVHENEIRILQEEW